MSEAEELASIERIEATRRIARKALGACMHRAGVKLDEALIGALYAVFDIAEQHAGAGMGAIEWLRSGIDVLEQQILTGQRRAH